MTNRHRISQISRNRLRTFQNLQASRTLTLLWAQSLELGLLGKNCKLGLKKEVQGQKKEVSKARKKKCKVRKKRLKV